MMSEYWFCRLIPRRKKRKPQIVDFWYKFFHYGRKRLNLKQRKNQSVKQKKTAAQNSDCISVCHEIGQAHLERGRRIESWKSSSQCSCPAFVQSKAPECVLYDDGIRGNSKDEPIKNMIPTICSTSTWPVTARRSPGCKCVCERERGCLVECEEMEWVIMWALSP